MRIFLQSILAIILPFTTLSQDSSGCKNVKDGLFYSYPRNSKTRFIIERKGDTQMQIDMSRHDTSLLKVTWLTDCVYALQYVPDNRRISAYRALEAKHKRLIQISGVSQDYFVYKMYLDKVSDFEVETDTLWMKEKLFDDRVIDKHDKSIASFPGGEREWAQYISKIIVKNIDLLTRENKTGTCYVNFIVNTNGEVSDVEALTMEDTKLAKISVEAIRKGPKWNPAIQAGKAVKAYRIQPVTFKIQDQ